MTLYLLISYIKHSLVDRGYLATVSLKFLIVVDDVLEMHFTVRSTSLNYLFTAFVDKVHELLINYPHLQIHTHDAMQSGDAIFSYLIILIKIRILIKIIII